MQRKKKIKRLILSVLELGIWDSASLRVTVNQKLYWPMSAPSFYHIMGELKDDGFIVEVETSFPSVSVYSLANGSTSKTQTSKAK